MGGGGGTPKKVQPESKKKLLVQGSESKCNKNSVPEEKYEILSSETLFPSADFATTISNLHSKLMVCLPDVSHRTFQHLVADFRAENQFISSSERNPCDLRTVVIYFL
jgi:hypothetical protein